MADEFENIHEPEIFPETITVSPFIETLNDLPTTRAEYTLPREANFEITEDDHANRRAIQAHLKSTTTHFLTLYNLLDNPWGEPPGTCTLSQAKLKYLLNTRHDTLCATLIESIRQDFPDYTIMNMEKQHDPMNIARVKAAINLRYKDWNFDERKNPDIIIYTGHLPVPEEVYVIEFTTSGDLELLDQKFSNYNFGKSDGHGVVLSIPPKKAQPSIVGTPCPELQQILTSACGTLSALGLLQTVYQEYMTIFRNEDLEDVILVAEESYNQCCVATFMNEIANQMASEMPEWDLKECPKIWSPEECLNHSYKEVKENAWKFLNGFANLTGTWRDKPEGHIAKRDLLMRQFNNGMEIKKSFLKTDEIKEPIELDILLDAEPDTPASDLCITHWMNDLSMDIFPIPINPGPDMEAERRDAVLDELLDENPTGPYLSTLREFIGKEAGNQARKLHAFGRKGVWSTSLGYAAKLNQPHKEYLVYGQEVKPFHLLRFYDALEHVSNWIKDDTFKGIALAQLLNPDHAFVTDSYKEPYMNIYRKVFHYVASRLTCTTTDRIVMLSDMARHMLTCLKGVDHSKTMVLPATKTYPIVDVGCQYRHPTTVSVQVDSECLSSKICGKGQSPTCQLPDGHTISYHHLAFGLVLQRTKPVIQSDREKVQYCVIYRQRKGFEKYLSRMNFSGKVAEKHVTSKGTVIVRLVKEYPYQLASKSQWRNSFHTITQHVFDLVKDTMPGDTFISQDSFEAPAIESRIAKILAAMKDDRSPTQYVKQLFHALCLEQGSSSQENEAVNLLSTVIGCVIECDKPSIIGKDFLELCCTRTQYQSCRQRLLETLRDLENGPHKFLKLVRYSPYGNGPMAKSIKEMGKREKFREFIENDPEGYIHPLYEKMGINTKTLGQDFIQLQQAQQEVLDEGDIPTDRTKIPLPTLNEDKDDRLQFLIRHYKPKMEYFVRQPIKVKRQDKFVTLDTRQVMVQGYSYTGNQDDPENLEWNEETCSFRRARNTIAEEDSD